MGRSRTDKGLAAWRAPAAAGLAAGLLACAGAARASDHLDTPTVIADPRADIGDIYAWTAADGRHLNLVMTLVGRSFSDKVRYVFHVDSGPRFGRTSATTDIACRFPAPSQAACQLTDRDLAQGDPGAPEGLESDHHSFRVFAGLRDDPFFNNVRGTRAAYGVAAAARAAGARADTAGCTALDPATSAKLLDAWRHTNAGPATNFLAGWTASALVVSVDLKAVARAGPVLAVWGATEGPARQIDRAGRPLTGNALLGALATEEASNALKERYNAASPAGAAPFIPEIEVGLALYDGFDGHCGDSLLAGGLGLTDPAQRYLQLASLLADDRLWVNSRSRTCAQLFAVERAALAGERALAGDCGGRTLTYDAVNAYRSLLVGGRTTGVDDGVHQDDQVPSNRVFPFLAPPGPAVRP